MCSLPDQFQLERNGHLINLFTSNKRDYLVSILYRTSIIGLLLHFCVINPAYVELFIQFVSYNPTGRLVAIMFLRLYFVKLFLSLARPKKLLRSLIITCCFLNIFRLIVKNAHFHVKPARPTGNSRFHWR